MPNCSHDPWTDFGRWQLGRKKHAGVCVRCGEMVVINRTVVHLMTPLEILVLARNCPCYWVELSQEQRCVRQSLASMPEWVRIGFKIDVPDLILAFGK